MWAGPRDQNNFSFQSSATGLANAAPGTALLCSPVKFSLIPRRLPFPVVCLNQFFWGVYFFPSFVLVRFLWALRKLECFFILKFVSEMKLDIHCACPSNGQKSGVRTRKGNHLYSLFVVCCEYIRLFGLWEEELSSQFFSGGSEGGVCTTQAIHRFYKTFWTLTTEKLFFNIFVIWQIEQSGIIAIKTN